jgi:hypothetical protein
MKANRTNDSTAVENTEPDDRDTRALSEYLTVLPEAPGLFQVVSQLGKSYTVDANDGDERPDDRDCGEWNTDADLPCFPCYREIP